MADLNARHLTPEILDDLDPSDRRAIRSRHDLRRVNAWMLQPSIMARALSSLVSAEKFPVGIRILDMGAGDGHFLLSALSRSTRLRGGTVTMLDRHPAISDKTVDAYQNFGWNADVVTDDVFDYLDRPQTAVFDLITANLFLHHFQGENLRKLLALVARRTHLLVACEPARTPLALSGSRMLWAIGCNDVTRHDAVVSVEAGFQAAELSAMWPDPQDWTLEERPAPPFTHFFSARRNLGSI